MQEEEYTPTHLADAIAKEVYRKPFAELTEDERRGLKKVYYAYLYNQVAESERSRFYQRPGDGDMGG